MTIAVAQTVLLIVSGALAVATFLTPVGITVAERLSEFLRSLVGGAS